jgi:hypothetical protein
MGGKMPHLHHVFWKNREIFVKVPQWRLRPKFLSFFFNHSMAICRIGVYGTATFFWHVQILGIMPHKPLRLRSMESYAVGNFRQNALYAHTAFCLENGVHFQSSTSSCNRQYGILPKIYYFQSFTRPIRGIFSKFAYSWSNMKNAVSEINNLFHRVR